MVDADDSAGGIILPEQYFGDAMPEEHDLGGPAHILLGKRAPHCQRPRTRGKPCRRHATQGGSLVMISVNHLRLPQQEWGRSRDADGFPRNRVGIGLGHGP